MAYRAVSLFAGRLPEAYCCVMFVGIIIAHHDGACGGADAVKVSEQGVDELCCCLLYGPPRGIEDARFRCTVTF